MEEIIDRIAQARELGLEGEAAMKFLCVKSAGIGNIVTYESSPMYSLHGLINYPDDEKEFDLGPKRMTKARMFEEIDQLILREPTADSFMFSITQHEPQP